MSADSWGRIPGASLDLQCYERLCAILRRRSAVTEQVLGVKSIVWACRNPNGSPRPAAAGCELHFGIALAGTTVGFKISGVWVEAILWTDIANLRI